jgi:hypothetical protein
MAKRKVPQSDGCISMSLHMVNEHAWWLSLVSVGREGLRKGRPCHTRAVLKGTLLYFPGSFFIVLAVD